MEHDCWLFLKKTTPKIVKNTSWGGRLPRFMTKEPTCFPHVGTSPLTKTQTKSKTTKPQTREQFNSILFPPHLSPLPIQQRGHNCAAHAYPVNLARTPPTPSLLLPLSRHQQVVQCVIHLRKAFLPVARTDLRRCGQQT